MPAYFPFWHRRQRVLDAAWARARRRGGGSPYAREDGRSVVGDGDETKPPAGWQAMVRRIFRRG